MKKILLVDDSLDICTVMASVFETIDDYQFSYVNALQELKATNFREVCAVLLDINLGTNAPSGIDCYNYLMDQGYSGKIIFFTGHAKSHPLVYKASQIPNVSVLSKPASVEEIEKILNHNN